MNQRRKINVLINKLLSMWFVCILNICMNNNYLKSESIISILCISENIIRIENYLRIISTLMSIKDFIH